MLELVVYCALVNAGVVGSAYAITKSDIYMNLVINFT